MISFPFPNKIFYTPYTLSLKRAPNSMSQATTSRQGYLLKFHFENELIGYSDLHPWPELGDTPAENALKSLAKKNLSENLCATLEAGYYLGNFFNGKACWKMDFKTPSNHYLVQGLDLATYKDNLQKTLVAIQEGFQKIKVKSGPQNLEALRLLLKESRSLPVKWRLDFNASVSSQELMYFLKSLSLEEKDSIDFIEDPFCDTQESDWLELKTIFNIPLAADRERPKNSDCFDVIVLKPSTQQTDALVEFAHHNIKRVVFTSNLAHPLGLVWDIFCTKKYFATHPLLIDECGLFETSLYTPSDIPLDFSKQGTFIDWNPHNHLQVLHYLESQKWTPLF